MRFIEARQQKLNVAYNTTSRYTWCWWIYSLLLPIHPRQTLVVTGVHSESVFYLGILVLFVNNTNSIPWTRYYSFFERVFFIVPLITVRKKAANKITRSSSTWSGEHKSRRFFYVLRFKLTQNFNYHPNRKVWPIGVRWACIQKCSHGLHRKGLNIGKNLNGLVIRSPLPWPRPTLYVALLFTKFDVILCHIV